MGTGIRILFEGMYEAIAAKSVDEGILFIDVLRRELVEIPRINAALASGQDAISAMFSGLNQMALAHFSDLLTKEEAVEDLGSRDVFMAEVERFLHVLEEVEDYNMSIPPAQPRTEAAIAARADQVGQWIQDQYHRVDT
jgi:hypothetical protein